MIKIENKGGETGEKVARGRPHKSSVTPRRREVCSRPPLMSRQGASAGSAAPSVSTSSPPGSTAATLRARRYSRCPAYSSRAFVCAGSARCHDFLAATVTATLATTALATDTALSVTIVLAQDVQLHVLVDRPRCSACEGRGVRGLQDARGILGDVHTHGMVGHRSQLFVLASLLCASRIQR